MSAVGGCDVHDLGWGGVYFDEMLNGLGVAAEEVMALGDVEFQTAGLFLEDEAAVGVEEVVYLLKEWAGGWGLGH